MSPDDRSGSWEEADRLLALNRTTPGGERAEEGRRPSSAVEAELEGGRKPPSKPTSLSLRGGSRSRSAVLDTSIGLVNSPGCGCGWPSRASAATQHKSFSIKCRKFDSLPLSCFSDGYVVRAYFSHSYPLRLFRKDIFLTRLCRKDLLVITHIKYMIKTIMSHTVATSVSRSCI